MKINAANKEYAIGAYSFVYDELLYLMQQLAAK